MRMDLDAKENTILKLKGSGSHGRWAVDTIAELEAENARLREALVEIRQCRLYGVDYAVRIATQALKEGGDAAGGG